MLDSAVNLTLAIRLPRRAVSNARTRRVARLFEMDAAFDAGPRTLLVPTAVTLAAGQIACVIGSSGSGKSRVLAELARRWPRGPRRRRRVVIGMLAAPTTTGRRSTLDEMLRVSGRGLRDALRLLCSAGLGEPRLWLLPATCLSAGQAERLALARLYANVEGLLGSGSAASFGTQNSALSTSAVPLLLCIDEFGAGLDRLTARILAANLRRWLARTPGVSVVVASAHDDLTDALAADWIWTKTCEGEMHVAECGVRNAE
ncbi:MAG: hypothetical protein BIFFINMI_02932 [Phycisphaerae bacterium]|nr:hypothetical protein [Phycisphaerae bacterium]